MIDFTIRHALAERAVARYEWALQAVPESSLSHARLSDGLAAVLSELDRAGRLVEHGERAAPGYHPGGALRDPSRRDPSHRDPSRRLTSRRLTRRQRLTPAERHLHNLHRSLIRLERAADTAVAVAIAHVLLAPSVDDAVEEALAALAAALRELQRV
jgi:hypothetical protein